MHLLARTRSQHFASSPRKTATPLRHRLTRQPAKRRRIISAISSDSDDDELSSPGLGNRERSVLSSETGDQTVNQAAPSKRGKRRERAGEKPVVKRNTVPARESHRNDVFASGDDASPRKRKRDDEDQAPASTSESGSWVEVSDEEEEEEPEFIAERDQQLIDDAPAYVLQRLRKAELVRLWKVAGMWDAEDGDDASAMMDDEEDANRGKKELVDGLIAARKNQSQQASSSASSRTSPKRKAAIDASYEIKRLRSATGIIPQMSSASISSMENKSTRWPTDLHATPKPEKRNRRARITDVGLMRTAPRRTPGPGTARAKTRLKERKLNRSKSMGGGEGHDRKARFGDDVKSPAKGLLRTRTRRSSTLSSAYTTTDAEPSPDDSPIIVRHTPARVRRPSMPRGLSAARGTLANSELAAPGRAPSGRNPYISSMVDSSEGTDSDEAEPTPLVARLRSRSNRTVSRETFSELEADAEEDSDEAESDHSPRPLRLLRSRDKNIDRHDPTLYSSRRDSRPERGAKTRAMEALKDQQDDDVSVAGTDSSISNNNMSVDEESLAPIDVEEDEDEDAGRDGPLTRAQLRAAANHEGAFAPRHNRRDSRLSLDLTDSSLSDEDEVGSMAPLSQTSESTAVPDEIEMQESEDDDVMNRTTRSGKSFGAWKSRKRRLRQEAIDDPDMEADVDEDEMEEDEESEEEEDSQDFEDIDLSQATLSSLVRLLREELVQLCETRSLDTAGTKPQLAKSLLAWYEKQQEGIETHSTSSSQATARPESPRKRKGKIIHAIASNVHVSGKTTPVLLRDHIHATDPQTPPHSDDDDRRAGDGDINLDLQELGLEDSIIKPEQLQKLERIGSGGFKDVYVGKFRGRRVAISEFRGHLSEMDIRELKLLAEFSHPNIVKFKGICIPEDTSQVPCMLVSELCENGDLFDYIRNVEPPSANKVHRLMLDIARGLEYLHTRKPAIIHRDCKSSNILINRAGHAKVGDFGLARVKTSTRSMIRSLVGTVNWQAPELWHPHPRYDFKVDVFSAAMVFWEMLSGWTGEKKYPWEGHNEHYIYDAVGTKQKRPSVARLRKHWGNEVVDLMEKMWSQEPSDRPTMTEVVNELDALYFKGPFTPLKH